MTEMTSLLDKIVQGKHMDNLVNSWANGKKGSIADHNGKCRFRFHEFNKKDDGDCPTVAVGLVAYWLHYRNNTNPLANQNAPKAKSIRDIFKDYTADRLREYKKRREQEPSSWRTDIVRDFYMFHIIRTERELFKQSEALFEYLRENDVQKVRDVMNNYMEYLRSCGKQYVNSMQIDLLMLRAIKNDDTKFENFDLLDKDERITKLDELEGNGLIKVAWNEGHRTNDGIRILPKGHSYLNSLENNVAEKEKGQNDDEQLDDLSVDADTSAEEQEKPLEELNTFLPTRLLQDFLKGAWFAEMRTAEKYDAAWTDGFIEALMASEYGEDIARDWAVKGAREKKNQLKGYVVGLLKDVGVLKGSYDTIAEKVGITDKTRTFSRYMGEGKKQRYADWVKDYVLKNIKTCKQE